MLAPLLSIALGASCKDNEPVTGKTWVGINDDSTITKSADVCSTICDNRIGCVMWSWYDGPDLYPIRKHECFTSVKDRKLDVLNEHYVTGYACEEEEEEKEDELLKPCEFEQGYRLDGPSVWIYQWKVNGYEECAKACHKERTCQFWTYVDNSNLKYRCKMAGKVDGTVEHEHATTGRDGEVCPGLGDKKCSYEIRKYNSSGNAYGWKEMPWVTKEHGRPELNRVLEKYEIQCSRLCNAEPKCLYNAIWTRNDWMLIKDYPYYCYLYNDTPAPEFTYYYPIHWSVRSAMKCEEYGTVDDPIDP